MSKKLICYLFFLVLVVNNGFSKSARYRAMFRGNTSTSIVIGWDQISGTNPVLFYGTLDFGDKVASYTNSQKPDRVILGKGMNNHFVRLTGLKPNTVYYFVIKDSEGVSQRFSVKTITDDSNGRLSVIAGGDSRNHREARCRANQLVSLLRPDFILFSGDMTAGDSAPEWKDWMDDWQLTIGKDGRIFPIVVTRGNHESKNESLYYLFDTPSEKLYYKLSFGGDLLDVFTLNSLISSTGDQRIWLAKQLEKSQSKTWRFAQYHHSMRPHTSKKEEKSQLILDWATLFHKFKVQLAIESDAHVVKWTYPIKPSRAVGSEEGFIRDDINGTVYIGEGCWGAPLRTNDDDKIWTRNSGSFNQFKWIFVDAAKLQVRTLNTTDIGAIREINHQDIFELPEGINTILWKPSNGAVLEIKNPNYIPPPREENKTKEQQNNGVVTLFSDPTTHKVSLKYDLTEQAKIYIVLLNDKQIEVTTFELGTQLPGTYEKTLDLTPARAGQYKVLVKTERQLIAEFKIIKER